VYWDNSVLSGFLRSRRYADIVCKVDVGHLGKSSTVPVHVMWTIDESRA